MALDAAKKSLFDATTTSGVISAMQEMRRVLTDPAERERTTKKMVVQIAMTKRKNDPGVWTTECAAVFGEVLALYAAPVYPTAAYPGQEIPPAYLYKLPPPPSYDSLMGAAYPESVASSVSALPSPGAAAGGAGGAGAGAGVPAPSAPPAPGLGPSFFYAPPPTMEVPRVVKDEWEAPVALAKPTAEVELVFTDGGEITTGELPCKPEKLHLVTHINLWNNDVTRIEGLNKYPNLMRLTLKSNDIKTLSGIEGATALRWVDVSDNDITDLSGMTNHGHLEWLNLSNNDLPSLRGLAWCPRLTYVNLHHNDLKDLSGVETLSNLMKLDLSSNDLTTIHGLEKCANLREVDLSCNDLNDASTLIAMATACPKLIRLNLCENNLSKKQVAAIQAAFNEARNPCAIQTDVKTGGGGCTIQ